MTLLFTDDISIFEEREKHPICLIVTCEKDDNMSEFDSFFGDQKIIDALKTKCKILRLNENINNDVFNEIKSRYQLSETGNYLYIFEPGSNSARFKYSNIPDIGIFISDFESLNIPDDQASPKASVPDADVGSVTSNDECHSNTETNGENQCSFSTNVDVNVSGSGNLSDDTVKSTGPACSCSSHSYCTDNDSYIGGTNSQYEGTIRPNVMNDEPIIHETIPSASTEQNNTGNNGTGVYNHGVRNTDNITDRAPAQERIIVTFLHPDKSITTQTFARTETIVSVRDFVTRNHNYSDFDLLRNGQKLCDKYAPLSSYGSVIYLTIFLNRSAPSFNILTPIKHFLSLFSPFGEKDGDYKEFWNR